MEDIQFGNMAASAILMGILALIYKVCTKEDGTECFPNRFKPLLAVGLGIVLGMVGMYYNELVPNFKNIVNHVLVGLNIGLSAVGLWELYKSKKVS